MRDTDEVGILVKAKSDTFTGWIPKPVRAGEEWRKTWV